LPVKCGVTSLLFQQNVFSGVLMRIDNKYFLRCIIFIFCIFSITLSLPLQIRNADFDILSKRIFPYFSLLYDKKLPSTSILFPDWREYNRKSFLKIAKKGYYSGFADISLTGQYGGSPNIIGTHIDNIIISDSNDSLYRLSGDEIVRVIRSENAGRVGAWYSNNKLRIFRGISGMFELSREETNSFEYEVYSDTAWEQKEGLDKIKKFHSTITTHFDLYRTDQATIGVIRLEIDFARNKTDQESFNTYSLNSVINTYETNRGVQDNYFDASLGYLLHKSNKRTFYAGAGLYSAKKSRLGNKK
jgi:hypothetical protein